MILIDNKGKIEFNFEELPSQDETPLYYTFSDVDIVIEIPGFTANKAVSLTIDDFIRLSDGLQEMLDENIDAFNFENLEHDIKLNFKLDELGTFQIEGTCTHWPNNLTFELSTDFPTVKKFINETKVALRKYKIVDYEK